MWSVCGVCVECVWGVCGVSETDRQTACMCLYCEHGCVGGCGGF